MKGIFTQPHDSWGHRLARPLLRPLVGGPVTPNHLTTLRLATGIAACTGFALGGESGNLWGGALWLISCFLDCADGELARLGKTTSRWGNFYDYCCDVGINGLLFLAIGFGSRGGALGDWTIVLGALTGASVIAAAILSERLETRQESVGKAYVGILGFEFEDMLYLVAPVAWFGWLPYLLYGAAIGAPIFALFTAWRLRTAGAANAPKARDAKGMRDDT